MHCNTILAYLHITLTFALNLIASNFLQAQSLQTLTYYENDSTHLELDLFIPDAKFEKKGRPVVLFVHGGGFSGGNKESGHTFSKYLASKGFITASISYELYMRDKSFSCDGILSEKIKAIQYAVNHLWLATAFILDQTEQLQINPKQIYIAGSSAGAETVLHAAYWDYDEMNWYERLLPENFKYSGVISGAGAIIDLNLIQSDNVLPTFLFHGDQDKLVPYATASHHYCPPNSPGWLMFFGSKSIYDHIIKLEKSTTLISYAGAGHEKSATLFFEDLNVIHQFLLETIEGKTIQHHQIK
jgi:acetyl esterase/lipase